MKKCPYCAEEIQDEAIFCRFCNHDLTVLPQERIESKKKTKKTILKVIGSLIALVLICIIYGFISFFIKANATLVEAPSGIYMTDKPVHMLDEPEIGVDYKYTEYFKVATVCEVTDTTFVRDEMYYELNCNGTIGWLPIDSARVVSIFNQNDK